MERSIAYRAEELVMTMRKAGLSGRAECHGNKIFCHTLVREYLIVRAGQSTAVLGTGIRGICSRFPFTCPESCTTQISIGTSLSNTSALLFLPTARKVLSGEVQIGQNQCPAFLFRRARLVVSVVRIILFDKALVQSTFFRTKNHSAVETY